MRNLITMLILAITASPLMSQDFSADATVNARLTGQKGNMGLVREYDGRKTDLENAGSVDINATATGTKSYLDLSVLGLNTGEGSAYFDLTLGALSVKGYETTLVHRQPWIKTGMLTQNSTWFLNQNEMPTDDTWNNRVASFNATTADVMSNSFKRTESSLKVAYTGDDYGVHANVWEEKEQGDVASRSSSRVMQTFVDRAIKQISLGFDAKLGNGALAYDYTKGEFEDNAARVTISTTASFYWQEARAPKHEMDMRSLTFRVQPVKGYNVTGSLSSRNRESLDTGYKLGSYIATLAASHRFGDKVHVTVKGYGRTEQMDESDSYDFIYSRLNNRIVLRHGEEGHIDRANFTGELLANYSPNDKMSFNLGYKLDNNYRRHAGTELFTSSQTYEDGGFVAANTQWNAIAKQNTMNIYTAGANLSLPLDAELGLGYKATRSNVAVFESLPTTSDEYSADIYMPVPFVKSLSFVGSAMAMNGENEESNHTNSSDHQNSYLAGLEWNNGGKYTAGGSYAFDQMSSHSDAYYAGYTGWVQNYDIPGWRPERTLGALYRYANDTLNFHASAKLSNEYTVAADSSYTRSLGKAPVYIVCTDGIIVDTEPSDIRIVSTGLNMTYNPAKNKNLSASLALRRDQWTDKLDSSNSGWVNTASVALSTKF